MSRHRNSKEIFWLRLQQLGHSSYSDYLRSPHWADFKRRFYASRVFKGCCWACGKVPPFFELHHRTYKRLGFERMIDVVALCSFCHSRSHPAGLGLWGAVKKIKRQNMKRLGRKGNFRAPKRFQPRQSGNFVKSSGRLIYSPT